MDCFEARKELWPPERPRIAGDSVLEARRHAEQCEACREYFAQDPMLLQAYDQLREQKAPKGVRERIFDAMARERAVVQPESARVSSPRPRWSAPLWAQAAVAVIALGTMGWLVLDASSSRGASSNAAARFQNETGKFVEDYLRRAVGQDRIQTTDAGEVTRFLTRELGVSLSPLRTAGLQLTGAEICLLEGRRGAMILYSRNGQTVSHYLVPREGTEARAPTITTAEGHGPGSPAVITWATPSLEQALVGDLPSDDLITVVQSVSSME